MVGRSVVVGAVTRSPLEVIARSRRPLCDLQATYAIVEFDSDNVQFESGHAAHGQPARLLHRAAGDDPADA
jgi:hypothetical protein